MEKEWKKELDGVKKKEGDSPKKDVKKVEVDGLSVDLCCAGCLKKVNKSKDKFSMLFSDKAYDKGFSKKEVKAKEKSAKSKK